MCASTARGRCLKKHASTQHLTMVGVPATALRRRPHRAGGAGLGSPMLIWLARLAGQGGQGVPAPTTPFCEEPQVRLTCCARAALARLNDDSRVAVRGAGCQVPRAVRGAGCGVPRAVRGAGCATSQSTNARPGRYSVRGSRQIAATFCRRLDRAGIPFERPRPATNRSTETAAR